MGCGHILRVIRRRFMSTPSVPITPYIPSNIRAQADDRGQKQSLHFILKTSRNEICEPLQFGQRKKYSART